MMHSLILLIINQRCFSLVFVLFFNMKIPYFLRKAFLWSFFHSLNFENIFTLRYLAFNFILFRFLSKKVDRIFIALVLKSKLTFSFKFFFLLKIRIVELSDWNSFKFISVEVSLFNFRLFYFYFRLFNFGFFPSIWYWCSLRRSIILLVISKAYHSFKSNLQFIKELLRIFKLEKLKSEIFPWLVKSDSF